MKNLLLERFKKRIAFSEDVYAKKHEGSAMNSAQKVVLAQVMENTKNFLNESFGNSVGTQRADMGEFKKFTLDITNVALPSLIGNEIVLVKAMASYTGY